MTRTPPSVRPRQGVTGRLAIVTVALSGLGLLSGCGSTLLGTTSSTGAGSSSTTGASTSTTVPINGEVAVAFPVVACTNPFTGSPVKSKSGWNPTIILAPVPTSLVGKVNFYTDGVHTLLAPSGWTCALVPSGQPVPLTPGTTTTTAGFGTTTTTAAASPAGPLIGQGAAFGAPGTITLAVYPSNDPNPPVAGPPAPGTEGVFATWASTGSKAGVELVCPFFTIPSWQSNSAGCSTMKPAGELTNSLTPDVTESADPAGVVGSLTASGGQLVSTGVVLFPQIPSAINNGSPVAVAAESCVLSDASLCPTVLSDFEVREFPVPA